MLATALQEGAPLWEGNAPGVLGVVPGTSSLGTRAAPRVVARVARGTLLEVHGSTGYDGYWWTVQGGRHAGRLVRQHDPAWSINP